MKHAVLKLLVIGGVLFLFIGCDRVPPELLPGRWRATATLPGGELPFFIDVHPDSITPEVFLVNGEERVRVREVHLSRDSVILKLPAFNTTLRARRSRPEVLEGELILVKRGGVRQVMPFQARHGVTHRFFAHAAPPAIEVTGRWEVTFVDDEGNATQAVGEFHQQHRRLRGTFMTPTGDYRFLEGEVTDSSLYLSCFDGGHAFLFRAKLDSQGQLRGDFWSGTAWHEKWTARPNPEASLPDPYRLTYLKAGYDRFDFIFPNINGDSISLSDPQFRGKVVLISIGGSWCPNCHDETRFLVQLYKEYHDQGLEVIGLMYEHFRDFSRAARQVRRFREKFGIRYPLLIAGYSDKEAASRTLPMLNHVLSYPTTIFVDRRGRVRKIHTGFTGPGTGEHYRQLTREYRELVEQLLRE